MIFVDRSGLASPCDWKRRVDRRLPRAADFWREATDFEAHPHGSAERDRGFYRFATAGVLKVRVRKGNSKLEFPDAWNHKTVRPLLLALTQEKCAYCESHHDLHLDHFQPKNLFPLLAYDLWNLFPACGNCNIQKDDQWPGAGGWVRPDEGDPASRFVFLEDGSVSAATGDTAAQAIIDDLKLDRPAFQSRRARVIAPRMRMGRRILASARSDAEKLDDYRELLAKPKEGYSEAINQCLRREWDHAFGASIDT